MSDLFQQPDDATPLEPEEREGLLQRWITDRRDLNEAEQQNIVEGAAWARNRPDQKPATLLSVDFALALHRRMFGDVWDWAGQYRWKALNIGIEAMHIPAQVPELLDDARFWVDACTYAPDEIAVRLHHRLVWVHPFPNGNGRHARLMADLLIERLGGTAFSWGSGHLTETGPLRRAYIAALRSADSHDLAPLVAFARS